MPPGFTSLPLPFFRAVFPSLMSSLCGTITCNAHLSHGGHDSRVVTNTADYECVATPSARMIPIVAHLFPVPDVRNGVGNAHPRYQYPDGRAFRDLLTNFIATVDKDTKRHRKKNSLLSKGSRSRRSLRRRTESSTATSAISPLQGGKSFAHPTVIASTKY